MITTTVDTISSLVCPPLFLRFPVRSRNSGIDLLSSVKNFCVFSSSFLERTLNVFDKGRLFYRRLIFTKTKSFDMSVPGSFPSRSPNGDTGEEDYGTSLIFWSGESVWLHIYYCYVRRTTSVPYLDPSVVPKLVVVRRRRGQGRAVCLWGMDTWQVGRHPSTEHSPEPWPHHPPSLPRLWQRRGSFTVLVVLFWLYIVLGFVSLTPSSLFSLNRFKQWVFTRGHLYHD